MNTNRRRRKSVFEPLDEFLGGGVRCEREEGRLFLLGVLKLLAVELMGLPTMPAVGTRQPNTLAAAEGFCISGGDGVVPTFLLDSNKYSFCIGNDPTGGVGKAPSLWLILRGARKYCGLKQDPGVAASSRHKPAAVVDSIIDDADRCELMDTAISLSLSLLFAAVG